jgi:hypothetical protein
MNSGLLLHKILVLALLISLGACSTFTTIDSNFRVKGKTLVVIAGLDNEANLAAARSMTDALKKNSRFQVLSQKQVAQAFSGYPTPIQGPYKTAYFEIETDYTKTDVKRIKTIQQKLGVDYVYVLWTPSETVYNEKIHQLHIIAQMFESPNAKEVGNGKFAATAGRTDCCLVPAPGDKDRADALNDMSEYVAKEIAEKMGMQKKTTASER